MYIKKYSNILYVLIIVIRLVHSKQISLYDTKKKNRFFFFSIRDCLVVIKGGSDISEVERRSFLKAFDNKKTWE